MAHVADRTNLPVTKLSTVAADRRRQVFLSADGKEMPNEGEATAGMKAYIEPGRSGFIQSTIQIPQMTRPLWSVSKMTRDRDRRLVSAEALTIHVCTGARSNVAPPCKFDTK